MIYFLAFLFISLWTTLAMLCIQCICLQSTPAGTAAAVATEGKCRWRTFWCALIANWLYFSFCRKVVANVSHMQSKQTRRIALPNTYEAFRAACAEAFVLELLEHGRQFKLYRFPSHEVSSLSDRQKITEDNYAALFSEWQRVHAPPLTFGAKTMRETVLKPTCSKESKTLTVRGPLPLEDTQIRNSNKR